MKRKRKRGRKVKSKKPRLMNETDTPSMVEENSGVDEYENDDVYSGSEEEEEGEIKAETPSSTGTDQPDKPTASVSSGGRIDIPVVKAVYSRVKVKIKTKALESHLQAQAQPTYSEPRTQSDTDKSSLQVGLEKQGVNEKMEDSANSLSETTLVSISENPVKKFGGIRIKSSKGISSSTISPCTTTNTEVVNLEENNSRYSKQELDAALEVIKKVMKTEAAEPFNAPVNPIALGIPDYFDVIDTPMDFGTICKNLEKGVKYMNADDVFKDVQYIWNNCYKYNNKGDFIVELMKRVKKNFIKLWISADLYGGDTSQGVDAKDNNTPSSNEMMSDKGASSKKRHGLKKHKDGCLCAICVMMRRRQEREEIERLMDPTEDSDDYLDEGGKPQSPGGEYTSSNMGNSPEIEINSDMMEKRHENEIEMMSQRRGDDGNYEHSQLDEMTEKPQRPKVILDKKQKAKIYENLRYLENPMLLDICGTLFGDAQKSVWNGPHSLVRKEGGSRRKTSSIHAAISKFMQ